MFTKSAEGANLNNYKDKEVSGENGDLPCPVILVFEKGGQYTICNVETDFIQLCDENNKSISYYPLSRVCIKD